MVSMSLKGVLARVTIDVRKHCDQKQLNGGKGLLT